MANIIKDITSLIMYGAKGPMYTWPDKALMKRNLRIYKVLQGRKCNIENPELFTEKIQLYKLYFKHPDLFRLTDKVKFKSYINEKLGEGHVIPMFGAWDNIEDFEKEWFSENSVIPEEFVLKQNLQSMGRCIKIIHHKSEVNFPELKKEIATWFDIKNTQLNSVTRNLSNGKPMVLAEQFNANFKDQLFDYKFFCFGGKPYYLYTAQDHFGEEGSHIAFYDTDWKRLDVQYGNHKVGDIPCPKHFEEMKEIAEKLSAGFPFVRVDFFDTDDKLFLAEMTFVPGGGFTPYNPISFDKQMGDLFILPEECLNKGKK